MAKAAAKPKTAGRTPARGEAPRERRGAAKALAEKSRGKPQRFAVSHARDAEFGADGLRPYTRYRDLGIASATNGLCQAHVIVPADFKTVELRK